MHEILTLQFGHRANHVCTHFWNAQESYFTYSSPSAGGGADGASSQQDLQQHREDDISPVDHDIHWRAGIGAAGEDTYTPRALIYDLKGGFGGMKIDGWEDGEEESGSGDRVW